MQGSSEYNLYGDEKSVVKAWRVDRQKSDGLLQIYVVLQYERMIKYLISDANNVAFQIIPEEHNFDFHRTNRDIHISTCSGF
jgi:hypothetical protein